VLVVITVASYVLVEGLQPQKLTVLYTAYMVLSKVQWCISTTGLSGDDDACATGTYPTYASSPDPAALFVRNLVSWISTLQP
jgi:hypothetical protein